MGLRRPLGQIRRSEAARGYVLVSPTALYALLLLAAPLATIFAFSFWTQDYLTIDTTWTLKNYREAISEPLYGQLLLRSVLISGSVMLATVLLAFPIAYFVSFHVPPARKSLWIFLITIPFWTSYLIRVFLWKVILGYNGVLNSSLQGLGLIDEPLTFILYNANAVVITLAHAFAPFAILPIFVALEKIDRSLLEASQDLGESRATTFLRVTLPLAMPGVVAAVLIVFIPTIGDYVTPRLVGGPNGLMIANMIQTQFLKLNNAPMGATLAVIAMVTVCGLLIWGAALIKLFHFFKDFYSTSFGPVPTLLLSTGTTASIWLVIPVLARAAGWTLNWQPGLAGALSFTLVIVASALTLLVPLLVRGFSSMRAAQ